MDAKMAAFVEIAAGMTEAASDCFVGLLLVTATFPTKETEDVDRFRPRRRCTGGQYVCDDRSFVFS